MKIRTGMSDKHVAASIAVSRRKVAITIDEEMLAKVDALVTRKVFSNRSQVIQVAVQEMLDRRERSRLAGECAKLDSSLERAMAEEGLSEETEA
jgi:metal-responsive CopG/Arc/MetJ family transcriptional regulator